MQGRAAMEEAGAARRRASARAAAMEGALKELAWREAGSRVGSGDAPARAQVGTRRAHQHAMQRARRPGVSVSLLMRAPQKQKAALQVGGGLAMQTARRAARPRGGVGARVGGAQRRTRWRRWLLFGVAGAAAGMRVGVCIGGKLVEEWSR